MDSDREPAVVCVWPRRTRFGVRSRAVAAVAVVVGASLVGAAVVTDAAAAGPSITVSPDTGLAAGSALLMNGSGFTKGAPSPGAFMECSTATGQPTVAVTGFSTPVPVSCSAPGSGRAKVNKAGNVGFTGTAIVTGTVGPPQAGADTGGSGDAAADAADYPCPPYPAQVAAGAGCEILFLDAAGQSATQVLGFTTASTPPTTAPVTTTAPCQAQPKTVTATPPNGTATVTVDPATCLVAGSTVSITATGLLPFNSSTNSLGTVLECNDDPGQPTVALAARSFPVSCTGALAHDFAPNGAGTANESFTVVVGTTGPPATGTDSAGNDAGADAAKYPCPPTPAQVSDTCVIAVGDLGGDKVVVPIAFNPGATPSSGTSPTSGEKSSGTGTAHPATAAATRTSSGSLAFTGVGPIVGVIGLGGGLLVVIGVTLIGLDPARRHRRIFSRR